MPKKLGHFSESKWLFALAALECSFCTWLTAKSKEKQMYKSLNQAHNEAALAQQERQESSHRNIKQKADSDDNESDEESDKEGNNKLLAQLAIKNIRKRAGKAQAKIAKLISVEKTNKLLI